jgi:hypothetical protein
MITVLTIGGTAYDAVARIAARLHLDALTRTLQGYDELAFSVQGGSPAPTWALGTAVEATVDFGSGAILKFKGEITDRSWGAGPHGWALGYNCQGLKYQTDRVPVTAPDLTGNYVLNRSPDDPYYATADAGLTLGAIFRRILEIPATATALSALGIQYATLSPPTLHATTVSDLALLTVVPPQPVHCGGECVFNQLDQILGRWMPKYVLEVPPSGIVRCKDTTDPAVFVPRTLTLPSTTGAGDPGACWPRIRSSTGRCATRVIVRGGPIAAVQLLSTADGTLAKAWSGADETAWRLYDFEQPKDAKDAGTITSHTSTSALIVSSDAAKTSAINDWSNRQGIIYLTNPVANGIAVTEYRRVISNTAQAGGGSFTVSWDASQPLDSTGYTKWRMVGTGGGKVDVGRLFNVREATGPQLGLNTYVGAHLIVRSPIPLPWANNSKSVSVFYATALVISGTVTTETPLGVEALPGSGQYRLVQPDCTATGSRADLEANGYPTTTAKGKPTDVQILAIYARGINQAVVPPDVSGVPQYQGTAFTVDGLQVTRTIDVPAYVDQWDAVGMAALGQQHLDAIKDTVYEGSGDLIVEPTWDVLEFNYSLNYAIAGTTSPWSAINAPVRSVTIAWPGGSGSRHRVSFGFTTQRRPFSGDDLYLHPSFTGASIIGQLQGLGMEGFAGMPIAGSFEMPVGQDQGDFTPDDLQQGPIGRGGSRYERRINREREEKARDTDAEEKGRLDEKRAEKQELLEKRQERQQAEQERVANARDQAYQKEMRRQIAETRHEDIEKKLAKDFKNQRIEDKLAEDFDAQGEQVAGGGE